MNNFVVTLSEKKFKVKYDGESLYINDIKKDSSMVELSTKSYLFKLNDKVYDVILANKDKDNVSIILNNKHYEMKIRTELQEKALELLSQKQKAERSILIKAPMPGMILKIKKQKGDLIKLNEPILILEAMKMENELRSSVEGILKEIYVSENSPVEKGAKLFSVE